MTDVGPLENAGQFASLSSESEEPFTAAPGGAGYIHLRHPVVKALYRARTLQNLRQMARGGRSSMSQRLHEASALTSSAQGPNTTGGYAGVARPRFGDEDDE